jgi:hypothetical protein
LKKAVDFTAFFLNYKTGNPLYSRELRKKITVKKMADMIGLNSAYSGLSLNRFLIQTRQANKN